MTRGSAVWVTIFSCIKSARITSVCRNYLQSVESLDIEVTLQFYLLVKEMHQRNAIVNKNGFI